MKHHKKQQQYKDPCTKTMKSSKEILFWICYTNEKSKNYKSHMKQEKLIQTQNSYDQKKKKRKIERNPDGKWVRTSEACHTRWVERMTLAPWLCKYLMVGTAARILVSSVMLKLSSKGTLRSTLTNTLLPFKSACFKVLTLLLVAITAFKKNQKKSTPRS